MPFLSLQNVTLHQGGQTLFAQTTWTVDNRDQWAIIGPNGSGKSTLMRALCGQVPVTGGTIVYHFAEETGSDPKAQIAYVFFGGAGTHRDDSAFYQARWNSGVTEPGRTVSEMLSEQGIWQRNPFEIVKTPHITPYFGDLRKQVITQLLIQNLLNREMQQLSNGERRKVSIARALLREPRLLILDNVYEGLDPDYRQHLGQIINILTQSPMRVFLVTTDPESLSPCFDHILVIRDHQVIAQGPRDSLSISNTLAHPLPATAPRTIPALTSQPQNTVPDVLIAMHNVAITYNGTPILQDVNWTVRHGERWVLLGHNGAGKTTLLSLIMGDHPQAYANEIELFGRRRGTGESIWEIKQRIGWMAPELQRHTPPLLNCFDVICSGWFDSVGLYRTPTAAQRAAAHTVMEDLEIAELALNPFRNVSETQQRLVLLARALVKHPQLLILDEPCQGLDSRNRQFVYQILDKSVPWADSLILVTHHTHLLPHSMTHILTLQQGRVTSARNIQQNSAHAQHPSS